MADALEEDRRATCEELSRATGVPATSLKDGSRREYQASNTPKNIIINDASKKLIILP